MIQLKSTKTAAFNGIKVLVYGPAGAGKTSLCATTGGNPLIISAEGGLLSLRGHDIPFIEVASMADLQQAYAFVTSEACADFDWICLDSISEVAEVVLNHEKKQTKDPRQAYGALQEQMTDLIRAFRDIKGKNVYFSCKQERVKDELTGAMLYGPSLPGAKLAQAIPYFFDEVFALRVENDPEGKPQRWLQTIGCPQYGAKDRSGALDQFEAPDLGRIAQKITPQAAPAQPSAQQQEAA